MPPIVVDASVGVKWLLTTETHSQQARSLLIDTRTAGGDVIVPPHMRGEVVNVLYQRMRSQTPERHITEHEAQVALSSFLGIPLHVATPASLYDTAFQFSSANRLPSVYDALYVVLAQMLGAELWTADQRLLTTLHGAAPWVRDIASYAVA